MTAFFVTLAFRTVMWSRKKKRNSEAAKGAEKFSNTSQFEMQSKRKANVNTTDKDSTLPTFISFVVEFSVSRCIICFYTPETKLESWAKNGLKTTEKWLIYKRIILCTVEQFEHEFCCTIGLCPARCNNKHNRKRARRPRREGELYNSTVT